MSLKNKSARAAYQKKQSKTTTIIIIEINKPPPVNKKKIKEFAKKKQLHAKIFPRTQNLSIQFCSFRIWSVANIIQKL